METITIQSNMEQLRVVEDFVSNVCDDKNLHNYFATISMSVLQAVENAIVHGNGNDSSKTVTVACEHCRGGIAFTVRDEGNGFDYQQYGDIPTEDTSGTGIFMMKCLADHLSFDNGGSTVRMEYMITGVGTALADTRASVLTHFYQRSKVGV